MRRFVLKLRGSTPAEARLVITTAPGEEAQVDYGGGPMVRHPDTGKSLVPSFSKTPCLLRFEPHPVLGDFEAMDPVEWLARMSDHIPDPGQHCTLSYGAYANRVRGESHPPRGRRVPGGDEATRHACVPPGAR